MSVAGSVHVFFFWDTTKAPFILRSLKWDRSEIDLRSVLRSVRDRMRTCSHWRLLIRQIIPNLEGLSSLFTIRLRVRWTAWHFPAFFFGRFLTFHGNHFFSIIRVGLCLGTVYRVMGCTRAFWRARNKLLKLIECSPDFPSAPHSRENRFLIE